MNYEQYEQLVRNIKSRYFRKVIAEPDGMITHHGDCQIYRARDVYGFATCTCGLIHDLQALPQELSAAIYPAHNDDWLQGDLCWSEDGKGGYIKPKGISKERSERLLKSMGFKPKYETTCVGDIWGFLTPIFGESVVHRLKLQLKQCAANGGGN